MVFVVVVAVVRTGRTAPRLVVLGVIVVEEVVGSVGAARSSVGARVAKQLSSYPGQHTPNLPHVSKQKHELPSSLNCGVIVPQTPAHVASARTSFEPTK